MSAPHDALFKSVFGKVEHARGALRPLVPAAVAEALDWETLALQPGSFVDPLLVERFTDVLYAARWRDGDDLLVYLLFEHQSSPDKQMPFRLLRYLVRIWERWLSSHPNAATLPIIVPVVQFHGDEPWSAPLTFRGLFDVPEVARGSLAPYLVDFRYILDDLSRVSDVALHERAMTALGELVALCFKYTRTRADLLELMVGWVSLFRTVFNSANGAETLSRVTRYILLVSDHVELQDINDFVGRELGPHAKDATMTAGERLIEQGMLQGERKVLLAQLRRRFGADVTAEVERRLTAGSPAEIELWAERIISAPTLSELFAD